MKDSLKNILRGIGSLLVIMPSTPAPNYSRFLPQGTPEERLRSVWEQVGKDISTAMEHQSHEQQVLAHQAEFPKTA